MAQQNNPQDVIVQAVDVISSLQSFSERIMQARSQLQQNYSQVNIFTLQHSVVDMSLYILHVLLIALVCNLSKTTT